MPRLRIEATEFSRRELLSSACGDSEVAVVEDQQRDVVNVEHLLHRLDNRLEQLVNGLVLDQEFGQLEEPSHGVTGTLHFETGRLEVCDDSRDEEHDEEVD